MLASLVIVIQTTIRHRHPEEGVATISGFSITSIQQVAIHGPTGMEEITISSPSPLAVSLAM